MAIGAGKYDKLCTQVRELAEAKGVVLIVIGGLVGSGFSCQMQSDARVDLVALLRTLADQIEADLRS